MSDQVKATITGGDQWTDEIVIDNQSFDLSIRDTFSATVTIQRRRKSEVDWRDVKYYTEANLPIEKVSAVHVNQWVYRAGVKAGEFTSGQVVIEIYI